MRCPPYHNLEEVHTLWTRETSDFVHISSKAKSFKARLVSIHDEQPPRKQTRGLLVFLANVSSKRIILVNQGYQL